MVDTVFRDPTNSGGVQDIEGPELATTPAMPLGGAPEAGVLDGDSKTNSGSGELIEPGRALGYFGRGKAFYQMGRLQEARTDLDRAAYLAPNNRDVSYSQGLALEALNDLPGARISFKKSCELRHLAACERLIKISMS